MSLYTRSRIPVENTLSNAREQAAERGYDDFVIVDVDAHHYENRAWKDIVPYMEDGPLREWAISMVKRGNGGGASAALTGVQLGNQEVGGRIIRAGRNFSDPLDAVEDPRHPDVVRMIWAMDQLGIDYTVMFPTPMLTLGLHPQVEVEVALARAYCRWLTRDLLPQDDRIKTMIYLPFNDPAETLKMVHEFKDVPGVVGFMVTSVRNRMVHHNDYAPVYAAIQETGKPLAFHAAYNWTEPSMTQLNKFISVHSLGFTTCNMIHMTNWIVNGLPERFPNLKVLWIESGLAWIPFLMQRLDNEYMMRTSEAPLLKKLPSDYMRDMYFSSQPMERHRNRRALEVTFEMMDAPNQLFYSSDYPHWDYDVPSVIYDLPFLGEKEKRQILGGNACEAFGLDPVIKKAPSRR
ncbi:amidohydrolase family protein [Spongiactinospora sp. TRM90649]|uniref:amidohydrolase family protein n=1 Tax=Spongiactinospora sp. TRM90649 TaxID=3031114 RepID=UPI0023F8E147|nr:amidohydrolase family protein [Spongiactinospora sp. TRM90649]MDF5756929.1 amidohydrolase family protein [Spongiactinospora sp. TRM90649]